MAKVNQAEFAKMHGVSRKTVTTWKARGWLVLDGNDVDVESSNQNIERYRKTVTYPARGNKQGNKVTGNTSTGNSQADEKKESPAQAAERIIKELGQKMTFDEARTMKETYFALLAKLEYEEKSKLLLPWQDMVKAVSSEYSRVRTRLLAIAPEHGPRLRISASTMTDQEYVNEIQSVMYEAMEELSVDEGRQPGIQ